MSHEFEAPLADRDPLVYTWGLVVGAWGLAGTTFGTAVGITAQMLGAPPGTAAGIGVGGLVVGAALGATAFVIERDRANRRPALVDGRGAPSRPLHGAMLGTPVVVGIAGLAGLMAVSWVGLGSPPAAAAFAMVALVVASAGGRVIARHRLAVALEALELGHTEDAVGPLHALAGSWTAGRSNRNGARLNLAMLSLTAGNADEALRWVAPIHRGGAAPWAATTRALALLLRGDPVHDAEAELGRAVAAPGGRAVQPDADAVRVLLVWRGAGPAEARQVGEHLLGPTATTMHRALLAALRASAGDADGARALLTPDVVAFRTSGLGAAIPELRG